MSITEGINHLGLTVFDLATTTRFFVDILGWQESGFDKQYPRTSVSDGLIRLTLWQVDHHLEIEPFDRRKNIGLHHLALQINSERALIDLHKRLVDVENIEIEFSPELVGQGPRKHFMIREPGGIRIEFIWPG